MRTWLLKVFLVTCLLVLLSTPVSAKDINVPADYSTISAAISAAATGDRIIVAPGVYHEVLDIQKAIAIVSAGGAQATIIDGNHSRSVVRFIDARTTGLHTPMLSGFTIRHGYSQEGQGGGITIYNSDAIIENNIISDNEAMIAGGAILIEHYADATIRNNTIMSNSASRSGGAIVIMDHSHPLLYNNTIERNVVSGPVFYMGGASGGAILIDGYSSPQIVGNTMRYNIADFAGGAISLRVGVSPIIEDNIITNNEAAYGGGIHIETEGGAPIIRNNTIADNQAVFRQIFPGSGYGGGISIYDQSRPFVVGNDIANNFATHGGGGIVNSEDASSVIQGNFIRGNEVTTSSGNHPGGGIYIA